MIKALRTVDEVELILINCITQQSELPANYILNGETHQGADLGHVETTYDEQGAVKSSEIIPFTTSDTFIVFDLSEDSEKARTQVLPDDTIDCFTYYRMKFSIYGDQAATVSQKLRARLTTAKVRQNLEANGVHIESFEAINSTNEFINNVYWQRKDLELQISCRYNFTQYDVDGDMTNMKQIEVIVES